MFQTEIIHYLQSFASDELTLLMRLITDIGYQQFLMLFLCVIILTIDFKKGFVLSLVLLWTGLVTFILKEYFDLPRPFHVDNTVLLLDGTLPDEASFDFSKRGATSFWAGLPMDVLEVTRADDGVENGFPSGHSSIAIAFWGTLIFLFRKKWVTVICTLLMILIPFSRMYLGVHFLADMLGGILLGSLMLGVFHYFILRPSKLTNYHSRDKYNLGINVPTTFLTICPLLLLIFLPSKLWIIIASMIGLGLGFLLLGSRGIPTDAAPWYHRLGRLVIGISTFALFAFILQNIASQLGWSDLILFQFALGTILSLSFIWMSIELSIKLGFFQRR